MLSVINFDFDGFLNKKDTICIQNSNFVFSSSWKVWKFGYLVFFARKHFCEFALAKNFTGIRENYSSQNKQKEIVFKLLL